MTRSPAPGVLWAGLGFAAVIATPALLMPRGLAWILQPLRVLHPAWVDERIGRLTDALARFREAPAALAGCFAGAVVVPLSFIVQMVPVSMNGCGVREATFGFYFSRLGLPLEAGVLVSLMGAALMMLFSLSGAACYVASRSQAPR